MKKIIILLIPFLLTGCASVTYNLDIQKDLTVEEKVNMSATKEYFDDFYMNLPATIVKEVYNNDEWMKPLKDNNYNIEFKKDNSPYPSIYASKKYESMEKYVSNTIYKNQLFEDIKLLNNNNLITIKTEGYLPYMPDDSNGDVDNRAPISNLSINIKLPYVVTNNNADKVDKSTNTYIWNINEKTEDKEINITFDKNKIYIYNISWYISLVIIIIIVIISIVYIIKNIKKNKKNNLVD